MGNISQNINELRHKYIVYVVILTTISIILTILFFKLSDLDSIFLVCGVLMFLISFVPYFYYDGEYKTKICSIYVPQLLKSYNHDFTYKNSPTNVSYPRDILRDLDITNMYSSFDVFDEISTKNIKIMNITAEGLYFGKTRTSFHGQLIIIDTDIFTNKEFLVKNNKIFYKDIEQKTKWATYSGNDIIINKLCDLTKIITQHFKCKKYRIYTNSKQVFIAIPSNNDLIKTSSFLRKSIKVNLDFLVDIMKLNELLMKSNV